MRSRSEAVAMVLGSLAALPSGRWVLAISGGRDSMVLLDAMATARAGEIAAVATFDHGTGAAATRAARLVETVALERSLPVVRGTQPRGGDGREAAWRAARWRFLAGWAAEFDAPVLTAHTRDDQVETIVIRLLRDAGPRGLAGMAPRAPMPGGLGGSVRRPLLGLSRAHIDAYARARALRYVEDPSNARLAHLRNRVRHEILPALERAEPGFGAWCLSLAARSSAWREEVARFVDEVLCPECVDVRTVVVPSAPLQGRDAEAWALLAPELAARAGVVMDRRGIARVAAWAPTAAVGSRIPLSGGGELFRTRATWVFRGPPGPAPADFHYIDG